MPSEAISPGETQNTPQKSRAKGGAMTLLKIVIAVAGIWWVIHNSSWNDTATIAAGTVIRNVEFTEEMTVGVMNRYSQEVPGVNPANTQPREMLHVRFPEGEVPVV